MDDQLLRRVVLDRANGLRDRLGRDAVQLDASRFQEFHRVLDDGGIRRRVTTKNNLVEDAFGIAELSGDLHVGQKHVLFDQSVALLLLVDGEAQGYLSIVIDVILKFWLIQGQGTGTFRA